MKSNQKFKKKGMMLLSAVLAAFLLTMVASGYFMTLTGSFNAIKSGGEAIQAQRYAEIEANKLSLLAYNDLDSKVSQNVWKKSDADEGWEYKVNLGPEKVVDPSTNSKQRIATVSIRKEGDATDRFQMKVPVSVKESNGDGSGIGIPDYNKAYVLASWNMGDRSLTMPDDGWVYIWDGNRNTDIVNRQGWYAGKHAGRTSLFNVTGITMNPDSSYRDVWSSDSWSGHGTREKYGSKIIIPATPTTHNGYASSLMPVGKGQKIFVNSIEDDGCQVWFIPNKK